MEDKDHENEDKSNLCRLCFGSTNVTVHIGQHTKNSTSIVDKIRYCTSLVVKVDDQCNQHICTACAENLDLIYNFKSKAIACDLELSKNVHRDVNFTYTQVSGDPLNITYKLDLEEQDSSTDIMGDSCVFNIVDGDELIIEQVNVSIDKNKSMTIVHNEENKSTITEDINDINHQPKIITNKLTENLNICQNSMTNNKKNPVFDLKRNSEKSLLDDENNKPKKIKTEDEVDEKPLVIVKNGKVVYICGVCGFEAETMGSLNTHRTHNHLDMGSFKCHECSTSYKTKGLLKRHTTMYHDLTHFCNYCEKRFSNKMSLDRHIAIHNVTPLEFQCVKCNAYFDAMDKMEDHLVIHYLNPSNIFSCHHCNRSFISQAAKNKHIDLEHNTEIQCSICHIVLPTKEAMEKHDNSVHQPKKSGTKKYACNTCGKYFSSIKEILVHRETHLPKV